MIAASDNQTDPQPHHNGAPVSQTHRRKSSHYVIFQNRNRSRASPLRNGLEQRVWERTAELEESNERFHTLVELLPEIVFETDLNERYTYANRQAIETFGVTSEKLREGLYIRDLVARRTTAG